MFAGRIGPLAVVTVLSRPQRDEQVALSRLRPVVLAAGTTVLGVAPLLQDVFWVAMAVTIMFGLAFGTLLTMLLLPVLYATFFKLQKPDE